MVPNRTRPDKLCYAAVYGMEQQPVWHTNTPQVVPDDTMRALGMQRVHSSKQTGARRVHTCRDIVCALLGGKACSAPQGVTTL